MINKKRHPIYFALIFFLICFVLRAIEYLFIRTDQTIIGEAFIHKVAGIILLGIALKLLVYNWADIGFIARRVGKGILWGIILGVSVYLVAYGVEFLIQTSAGNAPQLQFYVTSYAIQGNRAMQSGLVFVLLCIAGNIINVLMEEGVFRGLFLRLAEEKYSFLKACLLSSILFGLWHVAQPIRNFIDGEQSAMGALMSGVLLVSTSTLLAIQLCMLLKITGSIWAGMIVHFINNAGINLLHVLTVTGVDEMQTVRIAIAQTLSFAVVLIVYLLRLRKEKNIKLNISA